MCVCVNHMTSNLFCFNVVSWCNKASKCCVADTHSVLSSQVFSFQTFFLILRRRRHHHTRLCCAVVYKVLWQKVWPCYNYIIDSLKLQCGIAISLFKTELSQNHSNLMTDIFFSGDFFFVLKNLCKHFGHVEFSLLLLLHNLSKGIARVQTLFWTFKVIIVIIALYIYDKHHLVSIFMRVVN